MTESLHIAVAGAGVGGLAAATLLARDGHRVRVFDRFESPRPVGSGLMLQLTGLTVLGQLGLREPIEAAGTRIGRLWGLTTPSMKPVLDVRFSAWRDDVFALGIQRSALFDALLRSASAAGAEVFTSTVVTGADAQTGQLKGNGLASGNRFDLVIDAMGAKSPLTTTPRRDLGYGALWATLPWPGCGTFDPAALEQRYRAARQMAGVMPSGVADGNGQTLTYFWSLHTRNADDWYRNPLNRWKQEAIALWPETERLLDGIESHDQLAFARYRHRTHATPVAGPRLVHIGDAWHATSPQLGQGANMALLDACALAHCLRDAPDTVEALKRYRHLRDPHIRRYQAMSRLFTPVYQGDGRLLPFLRDRLAAPLSRVWPAPRLLAGLVAGTFGRPLERLGLAPAVIDSRDKTHD